MQQDNIGSNIMNQIAFTVVVFKVCLCCLQIKDYLVLKHGCLKYMNKSLCERLSLYVNSMGLCKKA